jgi:shikimate dehydrogenase
MMAAAFAELGLEWRYLRLPIPPDLFTETARALGGSGFRGLNVTIPHKEAALALAQEATPAAREIGAANTLTFAEEGIVEADNTDAGGFLDALGASPRGLRTVVLGAGGSARAVAWALRGAGAGSVTVWNRTHARARELAAALGVRAVENAASEARRADLLVNATAVGLDPRMSESEALLALGLEDVGPPGTVVDLVYRPSGPTPLCAWAARGGARVVGGIDVLVGQGARSLTSWTGRVAPLAVMRAAALG